MTLVLPLGAGPTPAAKRKDRALRVGQMACALLPHSAQSPLVPGSRDRAKPGLDEPPGSLCVFEEQTLGFLPELDSG